MDTTVQKCSGEVKQTPDCPLKRTQKNNLQPWRVLVFDTSGNDRNRGVCLSLIRAGMTSFKASAKLTNSCKVPIFQAARTHRR